MTSHPRPHRPMTAAQVRRRLPRRARHRPGGHRRREPGARRGSAREHGFDVEELHPPFDTEALTRSGHLLPAATREATRDRRRGPRRGRRGAGARRRPRGARPPRRRSRASSTTRARRRVRAAGRGRGRLDARPRVRDREGTLRPARVGRRSEGLDGPRRPTRGRHHPGVEVEHVALPDALHRLGPARRACSSPRPCCGHGRGGTASRRPPAARRDGSPLADRPRPLRPGARRRRATSPARASPTRARCCSRRRSSSRKGSAGPRRAWRSRRASPLALRGSRRPLERGRVRASAATTREFVDAVLGLLPSARRDTEFALGVGR